jgi:hypothetical protein
MTSVHHHSALWRCLTYSAVDEPFGNSLHARMHGNHRERETQLQRRRRLRPFPDAPVTCMASSRMLSGLATRGSSASGDDRFRAHQLDGPKPRFWADPVHRDPRLERELGAL